MSRVRYSVPYDHRPHREHRSKKGRKIYGNKHCRRAAIWRKQLLEKLRLKDLENETIN